MIINFHPKEKESKKGIEIIARLSVDNKETVVHITDKTTEEWQTLIKGDEKLVFIGPTYWWGAGHDFDKWAQDVLSYGFAYTYNDAGMPEGLLNGRQFEVHMTHGTPKAYAEVMRANIQKRMEVGIFGFCGAKVDVTFYDMQD
jgi:putative NADPH-quinone reductase